MKAISVDMGATWIRATIVDRVTGAQEIVKTPTLAKRPPEEIVTDLISLIEDRLQGRKNEISGIGIGVPTTFDKDGCLDPSPNIATLASYPLQQELRQRFELPLYFENDAQCYAFGEWGFGAGEYTDHLAAITLGSGIGLGLVLNGEIFRGANGRAGEIWWTPVNLDSLNDPPEHIESIVSGFGIAQVYEQRTGERLTAEQISHLAEQQEPVAASVFHDFGVILRNIIFWVSGMLDPDVIVLGGSVLKSNAHFYHLVTQGTESRNIRLAQTQLGDLAPLYGAAMLVFSAQVKEGENLSKTASDAPPLLLPNNGVFQQQAQFQSSLS